MKPLIQAADYAFRLLLGGFWSKRLKRGILTVKSPFEEVPGC